VVEAYVLVQVDVGRADELATALGALPGVSLSEHVTGPYDVVVRAGGESLDSLVGSTVTAIQEQPGVVRTLTCPVVHP
jgi:DNA-binding Lrp family transcriptional regulator